MEIKKRIYCHTCEKEYVITRKENEEKLQNDYKCDFCGNDFIYVETDRGHSIAFKFQNLDMIY